MNAIDSMLDTADGKPDPRQQLSRPRLAIRGCSKYLLRQALLGLVCAWSSVASAGVTWSYTDSQHFPPNTPLHSWCYVDNIGFNLLGYARGYASIRGGSSSSVTVFLVSNNAYGWRMKYYVPSRKVWITCGFDMLAVAQWQGQRLGYDTLPRTLKNWGCYMRNFNDPYSWRGAYWVSGCTF
jgi:hypothetical protein